MDISQLFTLHYYFELSPETSYLSTFFAVYFFLLFVIRAHLRFAASKHQEKKTVRKLQRKHLQRLAIIGGLGLISISMRHLDLPFFGMRVFAYALALWSLYELWNVRGIFAHKAYKVADTQKTSTEANKYMPKPKKKRKGHKRK